MGPSSPRFRDRRDAGIALARALGHLRGEDLVVLGLPRGGVPVAAEVARALRAPLDVFVVRKLGVPGQEELAMGAVASGGAMVLNRGVLEMLAALGMTEADLDRVVAREIEEVRRRERTYRGGRPPPELAGKAVVLIDDGLATGSTMAAAAQALRRRGVRRLIAAAPVGSAQACRVLENFADQVVCPHAPPRFRAVGEWYGDFRQLSDDDVRRALAAAELPAGPSSSEKTEVGREELEFELDGVHLLGELAVPQGARGLVLFADPSAEGHRSPRNVTVADRVHQAKMATLRFDLLSREEARGGGLSFDVELLCTRLLAVSRWTRGEAAVATLPLGYVGASTGAAAALLAAAELRDQVGAVVSCAGCLELAAARLTDVEAPTLLIVGGDDTDVLELHRKLAPRLQGPHELAVIEGAGHVFDEPRAVEQVARHAESWFARHLTRPQSETLAGSGRATYGNSI